MICQQRHLKGVRPLILLAFFLLFLGHAFSFPLEANEDAGRLRIISLVPTVTEELYLLGVEDQVVGVTVYCTRPPQAQAKDKVGAVIDVNVEKIIQLHPDIVIASPLTDLKQRVKLQNLGLRVEVFHNVRDFEGLCKNFLTLSQLVGKGHKAQEIVEEAKGQLDAIKKGIREAAKRRVFVQIGANPLFTATDDSFVNDYMQCAGGINIASRAKTGIYSREEVIKRNPDVILVVDMGIVGEKEKEVWLRYDTIAAVKNRRIFTMDSYRFCSPTPISFVETVKELVRIFHGQQ